MIFIHDICLLFFLCVHVCLCSSSVNGNSTAHHTEENAASAAAPTLVKETKVKASSYKSKKNVNQLYFVVFKDSCSEF